MTNADSVREIAKTIRANGERAVMCQAFVETGNTQEAVAAFQDDDGSIPKLIRAVMLESAVIAINRIFDRRSAQRHCFDSVFYMLDDMEILRQVVANGDAIELQNAKGLWANLKNDQRLERLRALRDYEAAHNIPEPFTEILKPKFDELFGVLGETIPIVDSLCAGTGITSVSLNASLEIWRPKATEYWERLGRGRPRSDA